MFQRPVRTVLREIDMKRHFKLTLTACIVALLCALVLVGRTGQLRAQSQTLWFADHEEPGENDWYLPGGLNFGGGEFDSGCSSTPPLAGWAGTMAAKWDSDPATPFPPPAPAGGNFGLAMTAAAPCGDGQSAGTRMFRWTESRQYDELYYKVWFYFPQNYTLVGQPSWRFWNILSWKSKTSTQNESFYQINVYNRADTGRMYLALYNWQTGTLLPAAETIDVPVNQWFHIEAFYKSSEELTGQVKVWQDGTLLWDVQNVQTRYVGGVTEWSVNNYGSGLDPQPAYFFIDNAEIGRIP
jgi:hypothetical protein